MRTFGFVAVFVAILVTIVAIGGLAAPRASATRNGDLNCDESIDQVDVLIALQLDAGITADIPAGCNADGKFDCNDADPTLSILHLLWFEAGITPPVSGTCVPIGSEAPTPSPSPTPNSTTFGDGTWVVGTDIPPGLYRNSDSSQGCYWARLSGLGGTLGETIANNFDHAIQTVQIEPGDAGFSASMCGTWSQMLVPPSSGPAQPFGQGIWIVGSEIAPGTWQATDTTSTCYWARLSGFGGTLPEIITNHYGGGTQTVTIDQGDAGFLSDNCGTWTKTG